MHSHLTHHKSPSSQDNLEDLLHHVPVPYHLFGPFLCPHHSSHIDPPSPPLIYQGSSCFKAFAPALLPACDVHLLCICLTCFLTSTQSLFKCYFLVTTFWFNLTTHGPFPPSALSALTSCFIFFTIALTTMRYAKYFSFLKIVYLVFINTSSVQWIAVSVLFKVQSQPLDLCLCHKYLWNGSFLGFERKPIKCQRWE